MALPPTTNEDSFFDRLFPNNIFRGVRLRNQLQNVQAPTPLPLPSAPHPLGFENTGQAFDAAVTAQREGVDRQLGFIDDAVSTLRTARSDSDDFFNRRRNEVLGNIPVNPFSDQLRGQLTQEQFGNIDAQTQGLERQLTQAAARRGFSSGGSQGTNAFTLIQLGEIQAKSAAANKLIKEQLDTNLLNNRIRAGIDAGLTQVEAQSNARLDTAIAGLEAAKAGFVDPKFIPELIGEHLEAEFGLDFANDILQTVEEGIKELGPSGIEIITSTLAPILKIQGFEGIGATLDSAGLLAGSLR